MEHINPPASQSWVLGFQCIPSHTAQHFRRNSVYVVFQLQKGSIAVIVGFFFHLFIGQNKIKTTGFTGVLARAPKTSCSLSLNPTRNRAVGNSYIRDAVDRCTGRFLTFIPGGANARGKKAGAVSSQRRDQNPRPLSHSGSFIKPTSDTGQVTQPPDTGLCQLLLMANTKPVKGHVHHLAPFYICLITVDRHRYSHRQGGGQSEMSKVTAP